MNLRFVSYTLGQSVSVRTVPDLIIWGGGGGGASGRWLYKVLTQLHLRFHYHWPDNVIALLDELLFWMRCRQLQNEAREAVE